MQSSIINSHIYVLIHMAELEPQFDNLPEQWSGAEWWSEVTQEDLVRVREWESNARKMAGQIAKSQKTNKQFALMLSFIFKYIEDEFLLTYVFETISDFDQSMITIFGHFLPNLKEHMDISPYKPLYADIWDNLWSRERTLTKVGSYYKELYAEFPGLKNIPDNLYIDMIMKQLEIQWMLKAVDEKGKKSIREWLKKEIMSSI